MSERTFTFRPWLLSGLLRPVLFVVAIVAGVIVGDRTDSFWMGLLGFLIAQDAGRALRRLIRGRFADCVYELLWPAAASGFAYLFAGPLDIAMWLSAFLAFLCGGIAKHVLGEAFLPTRKQRVERWLRFEDWGIPGPEDFVEGRWTRKSDPS